jgi:hypothetical protein
MFIGMNDSFHEIPNNHVKIANNKVEMSNFMLQGGLVTRYGHGVKKYSTTCC